MTTQIIQFEVGKIYATRSACDHDCIISVTVQKRTAKTVQVLLEGEVKSFRVSEYNGAEYIRPWGSYSMCPIIRATDRALYN